LWDAKTGAELLKVGEGRRIPIWAVAITPDGTSFVTGSNDRTATVWDAKTGAELRKFVGHDRGVRAVAVTADGARIITGSDDKTARVWDASTGAQLLKLQGHTSAVLAVAGTPDGTGIVTGSSDRTIRIWDAKTGIELHQFKDHTGAVRAVTITPDGNRIVAGLSDGTVWIWETNDDVDPLRRLVGHDASVRSVAVTPDGRRIVTGSDDKTLRIWDAVEGTELLRGSTGSVWGVAVTPDGSRVITGSGDSTVRVWDLARFRAPPEQYRLDNAADLQALMEKAKAAVPRCLTIEERKDFLLRPAPPGWCIGLRKYPYNAEYWTDWKAGSATATDEATAQAFAVFADKALMVGGAIRIAEQAAKLSIRFDPLPKKGWRTINLAHANMLLNRTAEAREVYLAYFKESLAAEDGKTQRDLVLDDFKKLRDMGREKPLLKEMEQTFRDVPANTGK
jgi:dipeptidyl aminopeptidase/acylaminoacyl peptidase